MKADEGANGEIALTQTCPLPDRRRPGALDPRRARRLVDGLMGRHRDAGRRQTDLNQAFKVESDRREGDDQQRRQNERAACHKLRFDTLAKWDAAEEELFGKYESARVHLRQEISRLAVKFRHRREEETRAIERKVAARIGAVNRQYENRKGQPGQLSRKEHAQIDESLKPIADELAWARDLTIRRLNKLPPVEPLDSPAAAGDGDEEAFDPRMSPPSKVRDAIDAIGLLRKQCRGEISSMENAATAKIADSFYLPAATALLVAGWGGSIFLLDVEDKLLWGVVGLVVTGIFAIGSFLTLKWPLMRMTKRSYPRVARIASAADDQAAAARRISISHQKQAETELATRREEHIAAAQRWRTNELANLEAQLKSEEAHLRDQFAKRLDKLEQDFGETLARIDGTMRAEADQTAQTILKRLRGLDETLSADAEHSRSSHLATLHQLNTRLKNATSRAVARLGAATAAVDRRTPDWRDVLGSWSAKIGTSSNRSGACESSDDDGTRVFADDLSLLPLGSVVASCDDESSPDAPVKDSLVSDGSGNVPGGRVGLGLHRRLQNTLIVHAPRDRMDDAVGWIRAVLWRALSSLPAGRVRATLIDPVGRGEHFTDMISIADADSELVGGRVWTTSEQIEARLGEVAETVENVLQSSLRDRYESVEDYNDVAGSLAQPYHVIAYVGAPHAMNHRITEHLATLASAGRRCGVFLLMVVDADTKPTSDISLPAGETTVTIRVASDGRFVCDDGPWSGSTIEPITPPPIEVRGQLADVIAKSANLSADVVVPIDEILDSEAAKRTCDDELVIPIGSQGAGRSLSLRLGRGVTQHVLIAGKTGSGKSSLLHSIITSAMHHHGADEVSLYLLDFKKGVEFKPYADTPPSHIRVVGIESQREFGLSVLECLDSELSSRGESFRAAGVSDVGAYRRSTGESMPRLLLVVDEFQELFVRDDRVAADCAMLLDRLVRQGRSFGMHVILASQSLAGSYSLPRATLGQMAVRIALRCGESDASMILSDDNTAARLLVRPGEAIYNDAGGLIEGNSPFQVAFVQDDALNRHLQRIRQRESAGGAASRDNKSRGDTSPVVFAGNVPTVWSPLLSDAARSIGGASATALLGDAVRIGPPAVLKFSRDNGRNVLVIATQEARAAVMAAVIVSLAAGNRDATIHYFIGDASGWSPAVIGQCGVDVQVHRPRELTETLGGIADEVARRVASDDEHPAMFVVIDPLERFRDLRQTETYSFSMDSDQGNDPSATLQSILRDGPQVGVWTIVTCGSIETTSRYMPRSAMHDLEVKVVGTMNASDSSMLIDSPEASNLSNATLLVYDDNDGSIVKFRRCDVPDDDAVGRYLCRE